MAAKCTLHIPERPLSAMSASPPFRHDSEYALPLADTLQCTKSALLFDGLFVSTALILSKGESVTGYTVS